MQYLIRWSDLCMHFKFEFVHAFQNQENINIRITFFWGEKLIVHIHVLTKIFENLKVITLYSAVTKSELGNKMCMLTRSIQARKKNVHLSLQIVRPTSQRTPFSKFAICFMNSKLHHWSHKYNVITFFQNLLYLRVWANDIWRGIGQCTHCFTSCYLMPIVHQNNSLQPVLLDSSLANKKTLIDITEPAILHEYGSGNFWFNSCHFHISMWMFAITIMYWRSQTIALKAYYISDEMLLHLRIYYIYDSYYD